MADDCELVRYEAKTPPRLAVWDARKELGARIDWLAKGQWSPVESQSHAFGGTPVFQGRQLAGGRPPRRWRTADFFVRMIATSPTADVDVLVRFVGFGLAYFHIFHCPLFHVAVIHRQIAVSLNLKLQPVNQF